LTGLAMALVLNASAAKSLPGPALLLDYVHQIRLTWRWMFDSLGPRFFNSISWMLAC
jgi:hypothetical protein